MVETMYAAPGIGLAAPPDRACPCGHRHRPRRAGRTKGQLIKLVNPEFVEKEGEQRARGGLPLGARLRRLAGAARAGDREGPGPRRQRARLHRLPSCWRAPSATRSTTSTASLFVDRLTPAQARPPASASCASAARNDDWDEMRIVFLGQRRLRRSPALEALLEGRPRGRRGRHPAGHARRDAAATLLRRRSSRSRSRAASRPAAPARQRSRGAGRPARAGARRAGRRGLRPDPAPSASSTIPARGAPSTSTGRCCPATAGAAPCSGPS